MSTWNVYRTPYCTFTNYGGRLAVRLSIVGSYSTPPPIFFHTRFDCVSPRPRWKIIVCSKRATLLVHVAPKTLINTISMQSPYSVYTVVSTRNVCVKYIISSNYFTWKHDAGTRKVVYTIYISRNVYSIEYIIMYVYAWMRRCPGPEYITRVYIMYKYVYI